MAHDMNQLQVVPGEQQAVEVVQVEAGQVVLLQYFLQSGNDHVLFNPGCKKMRDFFLKVPVQALALQIIYN